MKWVISLVIAVTFLPAYAHAEEVNAGFVQGLWYSSEPVFAGVPTRIYVALRNNTEHDLTGTVRFSVDGKRIGSSEVRALSGRLVEAWVDWTPTEGTHTVSAQVSDSLLHVLGGGTRQVDVAAMVAEDALVVEYDTDTDGTGNSSDTDDDNDGVSDTDEIARGTDPLRAGTKTEESKEEKEERPRAPEPQAPSQEDTTNERGLEKYVGEGMMHDVLWKFTEKIEDSKTALDNFRSDRNERLSNDPVPQTAIGDTATITRTKIEADRTLLGAFVSGVASILKNIWTFILWTASKALSVPALLELALLLGILYLVYKTARWYGRRQN